MLHLNPTTCVAALLGLTIAATGCDDRKRGDADVSKSGDSQPAARRLFDPLEHDKDVAAMKKPHFWHVEGHDSFGGKWEGYLVVEHADDGFMKSGFFEWSCRLGGGRYRFEGTFDPQSRAVHWVGYTVQDRVGTVCNAHYRAVLSEDGLKLSKGTWSGGISNPGTWSAELLRGDASQK